jgi:hypothetical protein
MVIFSKCLFDGATFYALFPNVDMEVFCGKITPALTLQSSTNESEHFAAKHSRNPSHQLITQPPAFLAGRFDEILAVKLS